MKLRLLAIAVILFASVSAAQSSNTSINPEPGLVKAGGLAFGLDVAWDNAMKTAGLKSPGDVAFERASEAAVAAERNNSRARERALNQVRKTAREGNNRDRPGLEKAERVLRNVSKQVPVEGRQGIQSALDSIGKAKNRIPHSMTVEGRSGSGVLPEIQLPEIGGDRDIESPGSGGGPAETPAR